MAEEMDRSVGDELTEVAERIEGDYPESAEVLRGVLARLENGGSSDDDPDGEDDDPDGEDDGPDPDAQAVAPSSATEPGDFLVLAVGNDGGICDCAYVDGRTSAFEQADALAADGFRAIVATVVADREAA